MVVEQPIDLWNWQDIWNYIWCLHGPEISVYIANHNLSVYIDYNMHCHQNNYINVWSEDPISMAINSDHDVKKSHQLTSTAVWLNRRSKDDKGEWFNITY